MTNPSTPPKPPMRQAIGGRLGFSVGRLGQDRIEALIFGDGSRKLVGVGGAAEDQDTQRFYREVGMP